MRPHRTLLLIGGGSLALYLLFFCVAVSAAHTVPITTFEPLRSWRIESPAGLAFFYAVALAGLIALYVLGLRRVRSLGEGSREGRRAVYAFAAAASLLLMFVPHLLSKDVFDYMVHGRILAVHRANPFQTPADAFPADEFLKAMGWPQFTTLYGPGWVSACALLAIVSPGTVTGSLLVYKIFFATVHLLNGALLGALLRDRGRPALVGEYLYLWNPLVVLQTAGEAHNDAFLMMWVLLGLLFLERRGAVSGFYDEALGVICLAVSVLVKYVTAPILLFALVVRARSSGGGRGLARAALLALIAAAVLVIGYLPYAAGMDLLHFLRPYQMGNYQGGALMVVSLIVDKLMGAGAPGAASEAAADLMRSISAALTLLLALWGVILLVRVRSDEEIPRFGLYVLMAYLLGATALLRVSYGVWIVTLAALSRPALIRRAAVLFSATLLALEVYWVYAIRMMGTGVSHHRVQAAATVVAVGVPILYLLAGFVRRRGRRLAA